MFFIPGPFISAITFPGVIIHELSHQLFCNYFKIPVYEVCYFRFGNPAGYVIHGEPEKTRHQALVSVGPFLINTILGALLTFPSALRTFEFDGAATTIDIILMWLGISIAMHAIPSTGDAQSMWDAVFKKQTSILTKLSVAPIVGLIYLLSIGSVLWLDLVYGIIVSLLLPNLLVGALA